VQALTFALQPLHAAAVTSRIGDCLPPLDTGQTDVVINRHDRPLADFRDTKCPPLEQKSKKNLISYINIVQHKSNLPYTVQTENVAR